MLITSDCIPHQGIATRSSARCVSAMLDVAGWAQPWDADNVRKLDEAMELVGGDSEGRL